MRAVAAVGVVCRSTRRCVAPVLQRSYRSSSRRPSRPSSHSHRRAPGLTADSTNDDGWGTGANLSIKQLEEVDYFRACAARHRNRRALRRAGQRRPMSDSEVNHFERALFGSSTEAGVNFAKYDDVPVERRGGAEDVRPLRAFQDIDALPPFLSLNIERCRYGAPTPVQKHAVPLGLQGHDVMCCSQTGSGKTCAFLLPVVSKLSALPFINGFDEDEAHGMAAPRALILAPTRELAKQTQNEVQKLCFQGPLRSVELCASIWRRAVLRSHERFHAALVLSSRARTCVFVCVCVCRRRHERPPTAARTLARS
jgi:ATP-dependent RNA helicase DDX3X